MTICRAKNLSAEILSPHFDWKALFRRHLGAKNLNQLSERQKQIMEMGRTAFTDYFDKLNPQVIWARFQGVAVENQLRLVGSEQSFLFPRKHEKSFLNDIPQNEEVPFYLIAATVGGTDLLSFCEDLQSQGDFLLAHTLMSLALETAEASIAYADHCIRKEISHSRMRFSFGYPLSPDLSYQQLLFSLLSVEKELGVSLTENFMMHPESSVTAMIL